LTRVVGSRIERVRYSRFDDVAKEFSRERREHIEREDRRRQAEDKEQFLGVPMYH